MNWPLIRAIFHVYLWNSMVEVLLKESKLYVYHLICQCLTSDSNLKKMIAHIMLHLTAFWFMYKQFVDSLLETDVKLVSFDIETNSAITAKFKNVYSAQFTA